MVRRLLHVPLRVVAACLVLGIVSVSAAGGRDSIRSQDLKEWLSYIASDDLEGRALYSTGIGLAAALARLRRAGFASGSTSGAAASTGADASGSAALARLRRAGSPICCTMPRASASTSRTPE